MFRKIFIKVNTTRCSNFNPLDIIEPKPKSSSSSHNHQKNPSHQIVTSSSCSSSSREKANYSTTSFSLNNTTSSSTTCSNDHDFGSSKLKNSVAISKESKDPFVDFRRSMLEMIYENEIYSKDELRELLDLFLELNSSCYHRVIVKAFMEIWNGVFSREACESIEFDRGN